MFKLYFINYNIHASHYVYQQLVLTNWKTPLVTVQLKSLKAMKIKFTGTKKNQSLFQTDKHKVKCGQWFRRFCDYIELCNPVVHASVLNTARTLMSI